VFTVVPAIAQAGVALMVTGTPAAGTPPASACTVTGAAGEGIEVKGTPVITDPMNASVGCVVKLSEHGDADGSVDVSGALCQVNEVLGVPTPPVHTYAFHDIAELPHEAVAVTFSVTVMVVFMGSV